MHDTTPIWLIAVFAVIVILFFIYLELRHQRKNPGGSHYAGPGRIRPMSQADLDKIAGGPEKGVRYSRGIADRANKARQETK